MRKMFLVPALILSTAVMAAQYDYEVTPVIGCIHNEDNIGLKNQNTFGGEVQFNNLNTLLSPELSVLYANGKYKPNRIETDIYRIALNGVYEYSKLGFITPLAKIGIGYETMGDKYYYENTDSAFGDAGVGFKIPFTDNIALKLEAVYMLKFNSARWDSNLATLAGINIAFGATEEPTMQEETSTSNSEANADDDADGVNNASDACPNTPAGVTVDEKGCNIDEDNDGVLNSTDACPNTPEGVTVDEKGCNVDDDNDGILNSVDTCPDTPANTVVDASGCMKKIYMKINFKTGSTEVDSKSQKNIELFAKFLEETQNYSTEIVGYTDNVGSTPFNQKLSQTRADAVKALLLKEGVENSRVKATGMGEKDPAYTNDTKEGRAQNRRIDAILIRH
jgi:OOP family OmpA-OmpF porin